MDWSKPVARFEEALATIRALWDSKGQLVKRDSPFFPLRDAIFDLPPYKGKWPEIWIAAHGPRMLRATGRYGDAWFPGFAYRPQDYAKRLEIIRTAASDAGRDPMSITPAFWMPVMAGPSRDAVDAALDSTVVKTWALNGPAEFYAHHGVQHPMGAGFTGMQDHVSFTMDEQTLRESPVRSRFRWSRAWCSMAHRRRCARPGRRVARPRRALIVVVNFGPMAPSLRTGLASLMPFNKVVRGLKRL